MRLTYVDENDFIKKYKCLSRYFRKTYKYIMFEVLPKLRTIGKVDGIYEIDLPVDEVFNKVYGKLQLKFSVKNDVAILEDIVPGDILIEGYMRNLPIYEGIPYRNSKDLFKIKLMKGKK